MARRQAAAVPAREDVVITRVFDAPRERVFEAWTKAEHLKQWFSPNGFTVPECEVDFRVGGAWRLTMRSPAGVDFWARGIYREIAPPERIVFTDELVDEDDSPLFEALTTVTFEDRHGMTLLKVRVNVREIFDPVGAAAVEGMEEGWIETLDHLAAYEHARTVPPESTPDPKATQRRTAMPATDFVYPADQPTIIITHIFEAPRDLVWTAMTEPKHLANWWGPRGIATKIVKSDLRQGGTWRFEHHMPDGKVYVFKGTYLEVIPPERLVWTFGMEGMFEDQLVVDSATLEDLGGRTRMTVISRFDSIEARDGMRASGMEGGARESYERLDELLATL